MNHACPTDQQGRRPCSCKLHTANSDGSNPHGDPWDWVDHICARIFMVLTAMAIVTVLAVANLFIN